MNRPLVSISCITYNHGKFIRDCLDGFLMQKTSFDFEILIHDDASTDSTAEIIREYEKKFPGLIKSIYQIENQYSQGQRGMNLKYNFTRARGKYIALCEGDDYWTDPYKLQTQVDFLEENLDYVLTHHDAQVIDEKGSLISRLQLSKANRRDFEGYELQKGPHLLTMSLCFRNVIKEFPDESFEVTNGDKFLISLLGNHGKAKFMADIKPAIYRSHGGGIWSNIQLQKKQNAVLNTSKQLRNYYKRIGNKTLAVYFDRKVDAVKMLLILNYLKEKDYRKYLKALFLYFSSTNNLGFKLYHCPAAHWKFFKRLL